MQTAIVKAMQMRSFTRIYLLFTALFFTLSVDVHAQSADVVVGRWLTADGESHIEVYKKGNTYWGKIAWLKEPHDDQGKPITDDNGDPILDMEIMRGFRYEEGGYVDGKVYDPESGKTYYGSMELDGKSVLKLRGSLDKSGWLGRTETWTRVQN